MPGFRTENAQLAPDSLVVICEFDQWSNPNDALASFTASYAVEIDQEPRQ